MAYTKFRIPSSSPGGWLNVNNVDRAWGFMYWMGPSGAQYATRFSFIGFQDADTFRIRLEDVRTNMQIILQELPGETPDFQAAGITYTDVQQNMSTANPG